MPRADLHVHCKASRRPSEWFLQKVGAQESYTDIDTLYNSAKESGMDFVTITDHNTIEGSMELVKRYPEDTFVSVEVTAYFPENRCKIHILLYDITPQQFEQVDHLRQNIYHLRDYIRGNDIAYSVAHGFYNINSRLNMDILEKLILLFDIFEGLNGARNRYYNETWQKILRNLTPEKISMLKSKYSIEPISTDPWIKGFTGGSDDHAGLFIGQTATTSHGAISKQQFINDIKTKKTTCAGRCNDYKSFAFSIYKIFCDYSSGARKNAPGGILAFINTVVFEDKQSRLKQWATLRKFKKGKRPKDKIVLNFFEDVYNWSNNTHLDIETKMERIYLSMGMLLDEFFKLLVDSFVNDFSKGDVGRLFRNLMSAFPALFISVPFFSSLRHLSQDREMMLEMREKYTGRQSIAKKRVLWFTDTFNDLNGVSVTLNRFRNQCERRKLNISFVACLPENKQIDRNSGHIMYLPCIKSITPEFYDAYTLNFPSLLPSMEMIYKYRPDRIIVSTPGPVGTLGVVMANMLGIECTSIYHTDFAAQAELIFNDNGLAAFIRSAINRFYSFSSHIKVPTKEYIHILEQQDYDSAKMSIFRRGMTVEPFNSDPGWKHKFREQTGIKEGTTLLWAGRISKDKNVDFLMNAYLQASKSIPDLNLVLCGAGPDFEHYQNKYRQHDRIHFAGYVKGKALEAFYEFSDLFVFPSTTDTFGMVIIEAMSRGLPALVTDVGGPQEIVDSSDTGYILPLSNAAAWVEAIEEIHRLKTEKPNEYAMLRAKCQNYIKETYSWSEALYDILEEAEPVCDKKIIRTKLYDAIFSDDNAVEDLPLVKKQIVA